MTDSASKDQFLIYLETFEPTVASLARKVPGERLKYPAQIVADEKMTQWIKDTAEELGIGAAAVVRAGVRLLQATVDAGAIKIK